MKRALCAATALWLASLAVAVSEAQTPPAARRPPSPLVGSIKEIMQDMVDPASDVVFESVSFEATAAGVVERRPRTDEEWLTIRASALILAEAPNLLKMAGRRVVPAIPVPGQENEPPAPGDLLPAEIQRLIDRDRATFNRHAQQLQDAALVVLKAIDARDVDALFESGETLDQACETCHKKYWYPESAAVDSSSLTQRK
jgi:hypothetical protein